jgi:CRP-like cAMP-binding protein
MTYIPGSIFGDIEIFQNILRKFTCKAKTNVKYIQISGDMFLNITRLYPDVSMELNQLAMKK